MEIVIEKPVFRDVLSVRNRFVEWKILIRQRNHKKKSFYSIAFRFLRGFSNANIEILYMKKYFYEDRKKLLFQFSLENAPNIKKSVGVKERKGFGMLN